MRVASADAWFLHGVVERAACVVEDLAHGDAAGDQVVAVGGEVVHGEDQVVRRARLGRRDSLAEDVRGFQVARRQLHDAEVARREVGVEPPPEILVERLRAVDVGNAEHQDFELHVDRFNFCDFCRRHNSSHEFPATVEKCFSLLSCPHYLLTVSSFTSSETSDYEPSEQEIHHEIEWFLDTTFESIGTSPYRGARFAYAAPLPLLENDFQLDWRAERNA